MTQRDLKVYFCIVASMSLFELSAASSEPLVSDFRNIIQTYPKGIFRWDESSLNLPGLIKCKEDKTFSESLHRSMVEAAKFVLATKDYSEKDDNFLLNLRPYYMWFLLELERGISACDSLEGKIEYLQGKETIESCSKKAHENHVIFAKERIKSDKKNDLSVCATMFVFVDRFLNGQKIIVAKEDREKLILSAADRLSTMNLQKPLKGAKEQHSVFFEGKSVIIQGIRVRGRVLLSQMVEAYCLINREFDGSDDQKNKLLRYVFEDYNKRILVNYEQKATGIDLWAELFDPYAIKSSCDQYFQNPLIYQGFSSEVSVEEAPSALATNVLKEKNKKLNPRIKKSDLSCKKKTVSFSEKVSVKTISPRSASDIAIRRVSSTSKSSGLVDFDRENSAVSPESYLEAITEQLENPQYKLLQQLYFEENRDARKGIDWVVSSLLAQKEAQGTDEIIELLDKTQEHLEDSGYVLSENESEADSDYQAGE